MGKMKNFLCRFDLFPVAAMLEFRKEGMTMRPLWKDILAAVWLGMLLPGIVLNAFVWKERSRQKTQEPVQAAAVQLQQPVSVLDPEGGRGQMELESYLTGVLLAEMPASFHPEALKAQAVAARTYTWKAYTTGGKHGDGSVCMDPSCCQGFLTEEAYLSRGGTGEALEKVRQAVEATAGFVLMFDTELIEATYFSSASGSTEAAVAVWGTEVPYLQAVESPEQIREDTTVYTADDFQKLLGKSLPGTPEQWFGPVRYTEGGGVAEIEICGETYTGTFLRSKLGLRSTAFQVLAEGQTIAITTRGYGHRVGMSQYGANALAEAGRSWQEILQHYYPGTTLVPVF